MVLPPLGVLGSVNNGTIFYRVNLMFLKQCCSHVETNLILSKPQGDSSYYFKSVSKETEAEGMSGLTTSKWRELGLQVKSF